MLCENCGKREANVRYEENINGRRKELNLCEECSQKLGIGNMNFNMPIDFSNFLGGFLEDFTETEFMPMLSELKRLKCNTCGYTFDDITNTGKLGCKDCYDVFGDRLDSILKRMQGENRHVGRIGKMLDKKIENKYSKTENNNLIKENEVKQEHEITQEENKLDVLKSKLKQAIQEEKYEEAAKLRDEIKKLEK